MARRGARSWCRTSACPSTGLRYSAIRRADYRQGDEVLVRTGWGTKKRAYELGIDYYKRTPSIHYDAAALLAAKMEEMDSAIFMTDCALVNRSEERRVGKEC